MLPDLRGSVFKRLETDAELRVRVGHFIPSSYTAAALDSYTWVYYRVQRRIIEDARRLPGRV